MSIVKRILKEATTPLVWYHGSKHSFDSFKTKAGSMFSSTYVNPIFLSSSREFAEAYAGYQTPYIYKVSVLTDKIFDFRELPKGYELEQSNDVIAQDLYETLEATGDPDRWYSNVCSGEYSILEREWFFEWLKKHSLDGAYVIETRTLNLFIFDGSNLKILEKYTG